MHTNPMVMPGQLLFLLRQPCGNDTRSTTTNIDEFVYGSEMSLWIVMAPVTIDKKDIKFSPFQTSEASRIPLAVQESKRQVWSIMYNEREAPGLRPTAIQLSNYCWASGFRPSTSKPNTTIRSANHYTILTIENII